LGTVSAWAGLHYFASRHGFTAPGEAKPQDAQGVLTWPEGNGWLVGRMAQGLAGRIHTGRLVRSVIEGRAGVSVVAQFAGGTEQWDAAQCVLALPLRVAARLLQSPTEAFKALASSTPYAAWVMVNAAIAEPLDERRIDVPAAWDSVVFGSSALGYVDAGHQSLTATPARSGPRVLTHYRALGVGKAAAQQLLDAPWTQWRDAMLSDLAEPHPDLAAKLLRCDVFRYGHAMSVPTPGRLRLATSGALAELARRGLSDRMAYAHSDLAGYSVFEEAYTAGVRVANRLVRKN
jgi:hypothetical protein